MARKPPDIWCQDFYDAVIAGKIDTDEFPIDIVKINKGEAAR